MQLRHVTLKVELTEDARETTADDWSSEFAADDDDDDDDKLGRSAENKQHQHYDQ